ncbi:MAG: manganese efflux pump MntP family protein [Tannerella sp.]|jgi:putative Mn2+ efflux pump MntP|nr:manganese efflux pump MntP family protein [Tannerella sp.]
MILEVLLITVGLSMDSLVVCLVGGAAIRNCRVWHVLKIAFVMGLFQGGLTLGGYLFGLGFERYVYAFDHWVAFGLLAYLGGRMIYDEAGRKEAKHSIDLLRNRTLVYMSFATSIDAIAVGVSLAMLHSPIIWQAAIIGGGTFVAAACGVYVGHRFGRRARVKLVGIAGGLILIGTGTKILLEHLLGAG